MRFGISYGNHGDGVHVEDVVVYIRNALLAAGEIAFITPGLLTDGINVVIEDFSVEYAWQILQLKKRSRARFIIVVSEFTDGKRFNPHIGDGHYGDTPYWTERLENFLDVAAEADAIWALSEYALPEYRALFPDKPVLFFPIGFDPFFSYLPQLPPEEKDIDLLFTGTLTPHRRALVEELERRLLVMTQPASTLGIGRSDLVRRAKAGLHLNLLPSALYSSVMRHHFLVMSGAAVVSERAQTVGPLDDFITQFDSSEFVERAVAYIEAGEWRSSGAAMRGRYREARPIRDAIRHLLVQSGYGGVDALSQSSGDGQLPPALAVPKLEDQPTDGSGRAGDAALDEPRAIEEFERLLAYHWEDDRQEFYARARTLYDWAEHRPVLRQWMAERVATVSQNVRPSLSHLKLWPLAFLLGQDAHLIDLGERDGRYTACLYRGRFYGIPSGRHLTPALVETHGSSELISAPSLSELRALFACADGATDQADAFPLRPISGLDVPWLVPSEVRLAGSHGSYNIVAYLGCFWGLPQELGAVDLSRRQDRARPGIILAPSYEELIARIDARSKVRRRPTEGANHPQC